MSDHACRPMGTALLLAAVDKQGPQLYLIEPSGTGLVRSSVYSLMMTMIAS